MRCLSLGAHWFPLLIFGVLIGACSDAEARTNVSTDNQHNQEFQDGLQEVGAGCVPFLAKKLLYPSFSNLVESGILLVSQQFGFFNNNQTRQFTRSYMIRVGLSPPY